MSTANSPKKAKSIHTLTLPQLCFTVNHMSSSRRRNAVLSAIPPRFRSLVHEELQRLAELGKKSSCLKLAEIGSLLEQPGKDSKHQIDCFSALHPQLRRHFMRVGKIQSCDWWAELRHNYSICEQAETLQILIEATEKQPTPAELQAEIKKLQLQKAALRTKAREREETIAAQKSAPPVDKPDKQQSFESEPEPANKDVLSELSEMEVATFTLQLTKEAQLMQKAVGERQAELLVLENTLEQTMLELTELKAEKERLVDLQAKGIPIVPAVTADVESLASELKYKLDTRDTIQKSVCKLEAQRSATEDRCNELAVQIEDAKSALAEMELPSSGSLDSTALEIEDLTAKLEEAEELLDAHRNRRVAASQELSVREGVAVAMSITPGRSQQPSPPEAARSMGRSSRSTSRPKSKTRSALATAKSQAKDEAFVRSMLTRLERTSATALSPTQTLKFPKEDPQMEMLKYWTTK